VSNAMQIGEKINRVDDSELSGAKAWLLNLSRAPPRTIRSLAACRFSPVIDKVANPELMPLRTVRHAVDEVGEDDRVVLSAQL
jgi:hypothetical protein